MLRKGAIVAAHVLGALAAASQANATGIVVNDLIGMSNNPGTADSAFIETQASFTNTGSTVASTTVTLSEAGFTSPAATNLLLETQISGLTLGPNGAANLLSATSCINACSGNTLQQNPDITGSVFTNVADILVSSLGASFSLSEVFTLTLAPGETLSFVAATSVAPGPVSTTPLPAALPLFAAGLGALGLLGRRKKRKAAP